MISRLPKKYKEKYQKEQNPDTTVMLFVIKVVGSTALMFIVAAGVDIYHLIH